MTYDAENRLVGVSGGVTASYVYDGDGRRVKATVSGVTTVYVGDYYEREGSTVRKYYHVGGQRIAVRAGGVVYWLHGDHLGSATLATDAGGNGVGELRYTPYGEVRWAWGAFPTAYKFTGQRLDESTGLYYYGARYYDPALGRFISADTLVPEPGNPQALNRYAYTLNNPLKYTDPSGHCPWCVAGKVLLQTAVDVGIDYLIARATGTDFNLASSLKVNALVNVTTLGIGSTVSKLRHLGKLATLTATHGDDALKIGAKVAEEVAEEAAERAGKEAGEEAGRFIRHHIATNKNWIRDPQWSRKFQELSAQGGMSLEDVANIVELPAELHKGPHSQAYHQWVFERLQRAIAGLADPAQIQNRLTRELRAIAEELRAHPEYLRNSSIGGR